MSGIELMKQFKIYYIAASYKQLERVKAANFASWTSEMVLSLFKNIFMSVPSLNGKMALATIFCTSGSLPLVEDSKGRCSAACKGLFKICNIVQLSCHYDISCNSASKIKTIVHKQNNIFSLNRTERKIDCFTINVGPVCNEIELHNRKYWDTLASSLYASTLADVVCVDKFVQEARKTLQVQPQRLDQVGEANGQYTAITQKAAQVRVVYPTYKYHKMTSFTVVCIFNYKYVEGLS